VFDIALLGSEESPGKNIEWPCQLE
jgi:hypothetical protein